MHVRDSTAIIGSIFVCKRDNHPYLGVEIDPCDLFRVSFGTPLNPRLGCCFDGDSRASGTTSNGSGPPPPPGGWSLPLVRTGVPGFLQPLHPEPSSYQAVL